MKDNNQTKDIKEEILKGCGKTFQSGTFGKEGIPKYFRCYSKDCLCPECRNKLNYFEKGKLQERKRIIDVIGKYYFSHEQLLLSELIKKIEGEK